ncbi:MAG: hypothetical protein NC124_09955 [Clostridium sp.]|nr:hypothetical protein [Clostridium sp.]
MKQRDEQYSTNLTVLIAIHRCKKLFLLFLTVIVLVLFIKWLRPTTSSSTIYGDDPEWISNTIDTSAIITDVKGGPCVWTNNDACLVYNFRFYDANSHEQITDYKILEELLSMFQYTDEPFIYDRKRSFNGNCFFYYNGTVPADSAPLLFSGFQGKHNFPSHGVKKIVAVQVAYDVYFSEVLFEDDIQKQLDNMRISPSNNHYN